MTGAAEVPGVDLLAPSLYRNGMPHGLYAHLREIGPVLWHPMTYVPAYPTDDVWSILAAGELGEYELDLFFMALTFAGSETTRNALAQGLMALLENPDELADLRHDPSLLPTAAEEIVRWSSPVIASHAP